jgi:hypothetical protein
VRKEIVDFEWDRDHVPPERIFAKSIRVEYSPQLEWNYAHKRCNRAYRRDEEYFVVSFAGHVSSPTAEAVMANIRRGVAQGHGVGLVRDVISRFGSVQGPRGEIVSPIRRRTRSPRHLENH